MVEHTLNYYVIACTLSKTIARKVIADYVAKVDKSKNWDLRKNIIIGENNSVNNNSNEAGKAYHLIYQLERKS